MFETAPVARVARTALRAAYEAMAQTPAQSVERFTKTQYGHGEQSGADDCQRQELWPKYVQSHALQKGAANDEQVIAQRIEQSNPLQCLRHAGDGKTKSRQNKHRVENKEIGGKCLLLGIAQGRYQQTDGQGTEQKQAGAGQQQDTGAKMIHAAPETTSTIVSKSISKGGGMTTGRDGDFAIGAALPNGSFAVNGLAANGHLIVAMESPRIVSRIEIKADLSVNGESLWGDVPLSADLAAVRAYLDAAVRRLEGNPDRDEIIADIEQAIADKCRTALGANKTVVGAVADVGFPGGDPGRGARPAPVALRCHPGARRRAGEHSVGVGHHEDG